MQDPCTMEVSNQRELAAAIVGAAENGPTVILYESPSGRVKIKYQFNVGTARDLTHERAAAIAGRIRRSPARLWN